MTRPPDLLAAELAEGVYLVAISNSEAQEAQLVVGTSGNATDLAAVGEDLLACALRCDDPEAALSIRTRGGTRALGSLADAVTSLQELARLAFAPLPPAARRRVLALAGAEAVGVSQPVAGAVSQACVALNSMLRERLPPSSVGPEAQLGLAPELLVRLDEHSFYLRGWLMSRLTDPARLTVTSPEGARCELLHVATRVPRPDVGDLYGDSMENELTRRSGFTAYFRLDHPSFSDQGWTVELADASGNVVEAAPLSTVREAVKARNLILGDLWLEAPYENAMIEQQVQPALEQLQRQHIEGIELTNVLVYGTPPSEPDISLIIPLHRRTDLMHHQLAQFASDPELRTVELIYVLDSPELLRLVDLEAAGLIELYRLPFKIAGLRHNAGIAGARNAGASVATGRLLVFCDSDVLPTSPGWLGSLGAFYDSSPGIGALGAKLVYEDDTIQHAGVFFRHDGQTRLWKTEHVFRGVNSGLPVANETASVPAVTGACLTIARDLFERMGGFSTAFLQGGYEDADLCLRLGAEGLENWYLPAVRLYHLEGQSYSSELRDLTWRYNAWLFSRLWGDQLDALRTPAETLDAWVAAS